MLRLRWRPPAGLASEERGLLCLPNDLKDAVLVATHRQGGHSGVLATANRVL